MKQIKTFMLIICVALAVVIGTSLLGPESDPPSGCAPDPTLSTPNNLLDYVSGVCSARLTSCGEETSTFRFGGCVYCYNRTENQYASVVAAIGDTAEAACRSAKKWLEKDIGKPVVRTIGTVVKKSEFTELSVECAFIGLFEK
jgi:hypothetical protein